MKPLNRTVISPSYFDELPEELQCVVADFLNAIKVQNEEGPSGDRIRFEDQLEEVECRSRSGFIPHSWNKGGLQLNAWATQYDFWSNDLHLNGKAGKIIQKAIDSSLTLATETFMEHFANELLELKIKAKDVNYHRLYELGQGHLAEKLSEYENENLESDQESTLHQIRVMYNGEGGWSIDVMHRISDAPYHRTCDDFKEFQFVAHTIDELIEALTGIYDKIVAAYL